MFPKRGGELVDCKPAVRCDTNSKKTDVLLTTTKKKLKTLFVSKTNKQKHFFHCLTLPYRVSVVFLLRAHNHGSDAVYSVVVVVVVFLNRVAAV